MDESPVDVAHLRLLGGFSVVVDGAAVAPAAWRRRQAAAIVKLLALRTGRNLHREQVMDALWPDDELEVAAAKLHKAAHYARRSLGTVEGVVLRGEVVHLLPDREVTVDIVEFDRAAELAKGPDGRAHAARAVELYTGDLLPDDPYEEWASVERERLRASYLEMLATLERWEDVVAADPADERAHLGLMRRYAAAGDRYQALRQFDRLDKALRAELGVQPGRDAVELRERILRHADQAVERNLDLIGRENETSLIGDAMDSAELGRGRLVVITGPPGIGKTALLRDTIAQATARGWRHGESTAATTEGSWAYAVVVDAVADLCRRQPTLLDGLADQFREEIDRALAGEPSTWSGHSTHQRLFVAVAELLRLASATTGVVMALDDLHLADDASLRLLHYLTRALADSAVLFATGHRAAIESIEALGMLGERAGPQRRVDLHLGPLGESDVRTLVDRHRPEASAEQIDRLVHLAGGNPYVVIELAVRAAGVPVWSSELDALAVAGIPPETREVLQRVAVSGLTIDIDEFVALSGLDDPDAFTQLDHAVALGVLEAAGAGFRFRHPLVRDALLGHLPAHRRQRIHRDAAARLAALGSSPARVGHHLVEAGDVSQAVPLLLAAAETEASLGAYRDALALLDVARPSATGGERRRLVALRADLLMALGDPTAVSAYREALEQAIPGDLRRLRARLARAAVMSGDVDTADAALDGIELDGGADDGEILLAQGHTAYLLADYPRAEAVAEEARRRVLAGDKSWQVLDLVSLQGLLAHQRGVWFDRIRVELRRTQDVPAVANAVFDGYLCPAEYLLYGPTPYHDVITTANGLRETALRSGALRAVAFATALAGEAALLSGQLDLADRELTEAVALHHDLGSSAGEAHSLQRLAEVRLVAGDPAGARALLDRALLLARWSILARHLLQRIYGTMIVAAPDPALARAVVDRAESTLGADDACIFCSIMLSVPAAIACTAVGDLDHAHTHLERVERSLPMWEGTSWEAAHAEARAHLAAAEGDHVDAAQWWHAAVQGFARAGQPLDVERCRRALATTSRGESRPEVSRSPW